MYLTQRMNTSLNTDVLIVGAGPTGLSLAAQLTRYGIGFVLIDEKEGATELSKAMIVHARTLEILDQIGLADAAVAHGSVAQQGTLLREGEVRARLNFADIGAQLSPFPFILILEQSKTEKLLYNHLTTNGKTVLWRTRLQRLTQHEAGVLAELSTPDGPATVNARYLVGCDGASSSTRHLTGLSFTGSTYPRLFFVADVDMVFEAEPASFYVTFGERGLLLLFPMEGENRWRIIGNVPDYDENQPAVITPEGVEERVKTMTKRPLTITQVRWLSSYKVHTRHAEQFSEGRCFLAGDAAHIHTPAGGQGMNTGIQDAYNLAWKLALVLTGAAPDTLLATYNEERLANAKRLLKTTDRLFDVAASENWFMQLVRDNLVPGIASIATTRKTIFPIISMTGINYRDSSLSLHGGDESLRVRAGDRLPYFLVDGRGIYDLLTAPCFHLLLFRDGNEPYTELTRAVKEDYGDWITIIAVPLYPHVVDLFGLDKPFVALLRPDNYVGMLSLSRSLTDVRVYMAKLGLVPSSRAGIGSEVR